MCELGLIFAARAVPVTVRILGTVVAAVAFATFVLFGLAAVADPESGK